MMARRLAVCATAPEQCLFRPRRPALRTLVVLVAVVSTLVGCRPPSAPTTTTQAAAARARAAGCRDWVRDPEVVAGERENGPKRIVSLAPNVTEMCCALGLRERLVGRTRYCDYPPGIEEVRNLGSLIDLSIETLVGLEPDLILVSGNSRQISDRLARTGLHYESVPDDSLDDLFAAIAQIGRLTEHERTAAELSSGIRGDLERITARQRDVAPARVRRGGSVDLSQTDGGLPRGAAANLPERPVRCLLLWTDGPTTMTLSDSLLDRHAP